MIRCGVAGLGRWGRVLIDSVQGKSDRITVTAGVTGRKERAVDYCAEKGIDLRDDFADLLSDPDIDAVVLATPHTQHVDQIIAAAKAGKPVFCDKPLTLTAADARRAAEATNAAGLPLCVGFNRRFLPGMIKLRELAASGSLGTLLRYGGLAALLYVADYYYNGSAGFNAVMSALGLHKYKLQQMLPQRALDWLKTKLRLHPASLVDKLWSSLLRVVRQKNPSLICRKLGICAGGTTLRAGGAGELAEERSDRRAAALDARESVGSWTRTAHPGSGWGRTPPAS